MIKQHYYKKFISLVILALVSQSCATMSEGEKTRLELAKFAKENQNCCIEKVYVGVEAIVNRKNEIEIASVVNDSPADKAGIHQGDVIVKIDGEEIKSKYQAFIIYDSKYPGDMTTLTIKRKGEIITTQFQLISHQYLNVHYTLLELVYKDMPVRLAVIPGKFNFKYSAFKDFFERMEPHIVGGLESSFIGQFRNQNNFSIIDRQKTDSVLNELKFQESGLVDNRFRSQLGTMLGATHLMVKDVSMYIFADGKPQFSYTMRLIEIESGKNLATSTYSIKSKESIDLVQIDLIDYINNKLKEIVPLEKEVNTLYENIRKELAKEKYINILANELIPMYGKYLEKLQTIHPNTEEVRTVHNLYIEGATLTYKALRDMETSRRQRDAHKFDEANEKITEANAKFKQFRNAIKELRGKHKVIKKN